MNERLLAKESLAPHLQQSYQEVIIDPEDLLEDEGVYVVGVLNTRKSSSSSNSGPLF